jgi:hypothetical protein
MATESKSTSKTRARKSTKGKTSAKRAGDSTTHMTTDHDTIRKWVEERGGKPATVRTSGDEVGILRIDFPGYSGSDSLEEISWDEFFEKFEDSGLAFLYQEQTSGGEQSRFNKLVSAEGEANKGEPAKSDMD